MDKEAIARKVAADAVRAMGAGEAPRWVEAAIVQAASALGYYNEPADLGGAADTVLTDLSNGYREPPEAPDSSKELATWVAAEPLGRLGLAESLQRESGIRGSLWDALRDAWYHERQTLTAQLTQAAHEQAEDLIAEQEASLER